MTPRLVEQRIVEAAALLTPHGAVTGWAALRWQGARWFDGLSSDGRRELPVVLATGSDDIRVQPGMALSQERLSPREIRVVDGLRVTVPETAVFFEMRYAANERLAAAALDMACFSDLTSIAETAAYVDAHPGWTGVPQARDALPLAEENSWSPREVAMRLMWVLDARLPPPLCNRPLFDRRGRHIGTPDLFDPEAGVVGEYDGALHLSGAQRSRDLRREAAFRRHGLEYVAVLAGDLAYPTTVAQRMIETRERALARRGDTAPSWTVTPPPWWTPAHTVEQRRALTGRLREVVLRHRQRAA